MKQVSFPVSLTQLEQFGLTIINPLRKSLTWLDIWSSGCSMTQRQTTSFYLHVFVLLSAELSGKVQDYPELLRETLSNSYYTYLRMSIHTYVSVICYFRVFSQMYIFELLKIKTNTMCASLVLQSKMQVGWCMLKLSRQFPRQIVLLEFESW